MTISQVEAAVGSTRFTSPKPGLLTWWSMFTIRARASHSAALVARLPIRARSPESTMTAVSGSSPGALRTLSEPGMKARYGGMGSAMTTSAGIPSRSPTIRMASAAPSVSASGFS